MGTAAGSAYVDDEGTTSGGGGGTGGGCNGVPEGDAIGGSGGCECGITDTFTRTAAADAWGTSDAGIPWTWQGDANTDASVANGVGVISATGGGSGAFVTTYLADPAPPAPTDITFDLRITTQSAAGTGFCYMGGYYGGSAGEPHLWMIYEVGIGADTTPTIFLGYRSSISGTNFSPTVDMTLTTGTWYSVRLHLTDGDFAGLRIWERASPEPSTWLLEVDVSAQPLWSSVYNGTNQAIFSFDAYTEDTGDNLAYETDNLNVVGVDACAENHFDSFNRTVTSGWGMSDFGLPWVFGGAGNWSRSVDGTAAKWSANSGFGGLNTMTVSSFNLQYFDMITRFQFTASTLAALMQWGLRSAADITEATVTVGYQAQQVSVNEGSLTSSSKTLVSGTWYDLRWERTVTDSRIRVWPTGTAEPVSWDVSVATNTSDTGYAFRQTISDLGPSYTRTFLMDFIDFSYTGKLCAGCGVAANSFDEFDRTVASGWGTTTDGHIWTLNLSLHGASAVGSGVGTHTLTYAGAWTSAAINFTTTGSYDWNILPAVIECKFKPARSHSAGLSHGTGWTIGDTGPYAQLTTQALSGDEVRFEVGDLDTGSSSTSFVALDTSAYYFMKTTMNGSLIQGKYWKEGDTEPVGWQVSYAYSVDPSDEPPYFLAGTAGSVNGLVSHTAISTWDYIRISGEGCSDTEGSGSGSGVAEQLVVETLDPVAARLAYGYTQTAPPSNVSTLYYGGPGNASPASLSAVAVTPFGKKMYLSDICQGDRLEFFIRSTTLPNTIIYPTFQTYDVSLESWIVAFEDGGGNDPDVWIRIPVASSYNVEPV